MQRREQQRRAAAGGGIGSGGYTGGSGGYSPVPRYEAPSPAPVRTSSPSTTTTATRAPAFKGSGMKLGSKKTKQSELLDALGGEAAVPDEVLQAQQSMPTTPIPATPELSTKVNRSSLPSVHAEG